MRAKLLILTFLLLFLGASSTFAVTVTISNTPQMITDQSFNFDVSIIGASAATNYLKADFFQPNDTSYFGFTYNGTAFYNGSDYSRYLPVTITPSGYSGTIQAKIDTTSSKFTGNGTYNLRVRRYTQSGNYTANESNIVTINVNIASITPASTPSTTPTPTPTPTPTETPQSTPSLTISNVPPQINSDQSFTASVNLSSNTNFYCKGAFKKAGGSNYFGLTKVSGAWIKNGSNCANQFPCTNNFNLEIKPDIDDSGYTGSGDYIFKVGGYDKDCGNLIWSNEVTIKINNIASLTPVANSSPQATVTPKISPSTSPAKILSSTSRPTPSVTNFYRIASVAAATASATPEEKIAVKSQKQSNPFLWIGTIFIFAGGGVIGYIYLKKHANIRLKF